MPISVGDAVLRFLGDTTNLDATYAKVNAGTEEAVKPAALAVADLEHHWYDSGVAAEKAAVDFEKAGVQGAAAGKEIAFSMNEAKGELALVGEATGITIPRHIRGFVAELPGVGKALTAAFNATAVFFLLQILVEGTQKLSEFIAETFIWTEANKEQYKVSVVVNNQILEQTTKLAELRKEYELIGLVGPAKVAGEWRQLTLDLAKNGSELGNNQGKVSQLTAEYGELKKKLEEFDRFDLFNLGETFSEIEKKANAKRKELDEAAGAVGVLDAIVKKQQQQQKNLQKQYDDEALSASIKRNETKIEAEKTVQAALADVQYQGTRVRLIQQNSAYSEIIANQVAFEEKEFQIEKTALEKRLQELKRDPSHSAEALISVHGQIEALEDKHHAKLLDKYATFLEALHKAQRAALTIDTTVQFADQIENAIGAKIQAVDDAFTQLGITGVLPLTELLHAQQAAYDKLKQSGIATARDIQRADIALLQTKIELGKAQGDNTSDMEKMLHRLIKAYNDATDTSNKFLKRQIDIFDLIQSRVPKASKVWKDYADVGKLALNQFASAFEAATVSALLSEDSFGHALRKGTASVLAEIAARSLIFAIYYTALGFARLAEYDFVGASNAFTAAAIYGGVGLVAGAAAYGINPRDSKEKGSSIEGQTIEGSSTVATSAPTPAIPQPQTFTNVHKFGGGALLTRQTMAVLGDAKGGGDAREAVLPLDNPDAIAQIVAALGGGRSNGHTFIIEGVISPDNLTKTVRQIDRGINRGKLRLTASNSLRLTRKA